MSTATIAVWVFLIAFFLPTWSKFRMDEETRVSAGDVRIVHISDTHSRHDQVTSDLMALDADILIHTGDFSDDGTDAEWNAFNNWLGQVSNKFPLGVYVVLGNHDYKFLNGLSLSDEMIGVLADDEMRRQYLQKRLSNAIVLDNYQMKTLKVGKNGELSLNLFPIPWNPWQSSPTHPDRVLAAGSRPSSDHDRVFLKWVATVPEEKKRMWAAGEAWRYYEIPAGVDILMSHIPPFGVFDQQPIYTNWGSSLPLMKAVNATKPRMHLFGHVHAQRGYWEKTSNNTIIGGVQYAKSTNEEVKTRLMRGNATQFMCNTAMMSDRTVQPFAKKKIVGAPRLITGVWTDEGWHFHGTGGGPKF